jgi:tetratricopeptide (TPR) repeat protein
MIKKKLLLLVIQLIFSYTVYSQTTDNVELQKMYEEDQSSRQVGNINWTILSKQDSLREIRVYEFIKDGKIITGKDYYNSAMIFQHGRDSIAYGMAVRQMKKAIELDTTINKWLLAAAIDRDLVSRGKPQIYGTQYFKNKGQSKWKRREIDTTKVTDEERKYYHVETLAEQKLKERRMNLRSIAELYSQEKSIDKTIQFIIVENKDESKSEYNVSENAINEFGYSLMNENKTDEALKIFKLNTELFPNGYNAFDSYGECLLKLNKKEEALKAYAKSLELNPKNSNARKVLEQSK